MPTTSKPPDGPSTAGEGPRRPWRGWSLGARLGVALVVAAVVPMAVLTRFSIESGRDAVERAQLDAVEGAATVAAIAVREYLVGVGARADQLGTRDDVVAWVAGTRDGAAPGLAGDLAAPDVAAVAIFDAAGVVVADAPDGSGQTNPDSIVAERWFADAVAGRLSIGGVQAGPASGLGSVTVAAPARNPGLAVVGVAALEVRGSDVLFAANEAPLSPGGQVVLVEPDGLVVAARDSRIAGKNLADLGLEELTDSLAQRGAGTLSGVGLEGRGPQVAAWDEAVPGLSAVVLQPRQVFMGPIDTLSRTTTVLFVLVGLAAIAAAVLLARRLSRPVGVLTAAARKVEAGEPVDADALGVISASHDDVGRLARVFSTMADQVASRERKLREQVRALKVEIDHERRQQAVEEVTDTDFFRDLQSRAAEMRARAKGERPTVSDGGDTP